MRKLILALLLLGAALFTPSMWRVQQTEALAQTIVTAAQVNGTWRSKNGEIKVWALGNQQLRVELNAVYEYNSDAGPMANTGEASGTAHIEGDTATFKPADAEDECLITLRFTGGKLIVTQESNCGFGHNVTAAGTYRKASARKPKFERG